MGSPSSTRKKGAGRPPHAGDRIVLLTGPEVFLRDEYTLQLREALKAAHGVVHEVKFDGATAAVADVLDECRTPSLLPGHKLVIVDAAEMLAREAARPALERYARAPGDVATLVLRSERWRAGNLDRLIERVGAIIRCEAVDETAAKRWAGRRASARHGVELTAPAAAALVDRVGPNLLRLDGELAKLALRVGPGATVTVEHVAELVGPTREQAAWDIQNVLLTGTPAEVLAAVRRILDGSRREAHIPLSWAMMDLAWKLHAANRGLRQGDPPGALGRTLRLWPEHRRTQVLSVAGRCPPAELARLVRLTVDTDARLKSGLGNADRNLERLALAFCATIQQPPDRGPAPKA